jgi:hypothetical protein
MTVGLAIYMLLALRVLQLPASQRTTDLIWPAIALAITHAFHPSTLVLQPSLWYLGWSSRRGPTEPEAGGCAARRESLLAAARILVPTLVMGLAVLILMEAGGHGLSALFGADAPGGGDQRWFVPLLGTTTRWEHYTMFSWAHLLDIINEQLLTAPVVLPSIFLVCAIASRRLSWRDHTLRFLLLAALSYLCLTLVWNPDYGGRRDWDLFAPASVPVAILLAYLLPRAIPERPSLRAASSALVATQLFHTTAWIVQNTQPWFWPT